MSTWLLLIALYSDDQRLLLELWQFKCKLRLEIPPVLVIISVALGKQKEYKYLLLPPMTFSTGSTQF
jgi:hypothetical protein